MRAHFFNNLSQHVININILARTQKEVKHSIRLVTNLVGIFHSKILPIQISRYGKFFYWRKKKGYLTLGFYFLLTPGAF